MDEKLYQMFDGYFDKKRPIILFIHLFIIIQFILNSHGLNFNNFYINLSEVMVFFIQNYPTAPTLNNIGMF